MSTSTDQQQEPSLDQSPTKDQQPISTSVSTTDETLVAQMGDSSLSSSVSGDASHLNVTLDFVPHQATSINEVVPESEIIVQSSSSEVKEHFVKKEPVVFINEKDVLKDYNIPHATHTYQSLVTRNVKQIVSNQTTVVGTINEAAGIDPSPIRRRADFKEGVVSGCTFGTQTPTTCYESFKFAAERHPTRPCLGVIEQVQSTTATTTGAGASNAPPTLGVKFETYAQVQEKVLNIGSALVNTGLKPHYHIAIYSKNRPEWQVVSEACHTQSLVTIALYDTLGEESSVYIMNHGEVVTLFVSGDDVFGKNVLKWVNQCEYLKHVVLFDNFENAKYAEQVTSWKEEFKNKTKDTVKLYTFAEFAALGAGEKRATPTPPRACDLSSIMYTSGTTGTPKGVMLTHLNIMSTIAGVIGNLLHISEHDRVISYLPLAHILERAAEMAFLQVGGSIGYWRGDVRKLKDDIGIVQPTLFPAVPRVLDRLYDGIRDQIKQKKKIAQMIFQKSYNAKLKAIQTHGIEVKNPILDMLVFNKLKAAVGGKLKGILSGGAPLRKEVQEFISVAFGCPVVQGYGLTETTAGSTIQLPYDFSTGHGGCLLPCLEVKLVDVPDMNYSSGEICIRGPNVSIGYYKEEEKTREVFDKDGFFHTQDIGTWQKSGALAIVDRIKNIFKLAQGEYVAAENIEGKLGEANCVSRLWVYGDSYKTFLVGFVAVNGLKLLDWAIQNQKIQGVTAVSQLSESAQAEHLERLCADESVNKMILKDLERVGKEKKLLGFEMVRVIKLLPKDFEFYPGCTTPKLSLVRNKLRDLFKKDIDEMYEKNNF